MNVSRATIMRALGIVAAGTLIALVLLPFARRLPNFVVPDDGFFYARIAYNLAHGRGSTFDGVHTTSGYHVPWALALAAVSKVIGLFTGDVVVHLGGHLALACTIALATARRFFRETASRVAAFVLIISMFGLTEMVLAVPILLAILERVLCKGGRDARLIPLAVALPLVRVDLSCVLVAVGVMLLLLHERRRALALIGATTLGVALQLLMMKAAFGELVSVAALLKVSGPGSILEDVTDNVNNGSFAAFMYAAQLAIAARTVMLRNARATWAATLGCLSFVVMHTCFSIIRPWYWTPCWLGLLFLFEQASMSAGPAALRQARVAVFGVAFVFVVHGVRSELVYAEDARRAATFLSELRARVPSQAKVFTYDSPGFLGYFSGFDVVDGDGLVNDYAFARRYLERRLAGYLDEERLCWIVAADVDQDPIPDLSGLVVRREDAELLFAIRRNKANQADFALYRLRTPRCTP